MSVGDTYQANLFFTLQGQTENVYTFYLREDTEPTSFEQEAEIAIYLRDELADEIAASFTPDLHFVCAEVKRILSPASPGLLNSIQRTLAFDEPGTNGTSNSLPGQCSMVIQTLPDLDDGNPSHRGRDYWTGFPVDAQVDGVWTDAAYDLLADQLVMSLMGTIQGSDGGQYRWGNFSPKLLAQRVGPPIDLTIDPWKEVRNMRGLKQVRTQRRRQALNPCDKYFEVKTPF